MYDVNFVYNALSFLRLTSRSSVNHVFVVLTKHILYLVVAKFSTLLSSPFAVSFYQPKGLKISRYFIINFRITEAKRFMKSWFYFWEDFYQLFPSKVFSTEVLKDFQQRLF